MPDLRLVEFLQRSDECLVFALRVVDLERVAWREGRARARELEAFAADAFGRVCAATFHGAGACAHEAGSDLLIAAVAAPEVDLPRAARAVLAELVRGVEDRTGLSLEAGWTVHARGAGAGCRLRETVAAALDRGRRERERYAFFAALGHEMRSPLMSIDGFLQTLLDCELDDATRLRFIQIAQREAGRLRRLVDGMYALSLTDLDSELKRNVSCDVQSAVERAADAVYAAAAGRGTRLEIRSRVRCAVPLAAEHAVAIFTNLLENAIKHGYDNGRIEVYLEERGDSLTVCIDDDGPGVAEEDRASIFEELVRGRATAAGDGLGLAIVRATVERAGGDARVVRSPLGGARFIVEIPLAARRNVHNGITLRSP